MAIIIRKHLKLVHNAERDREPVEIGSQMSDETRKFVKLVAKAAARRDHMLFLEKQWSK